MSLLAGLSLSAQAKNVQRRPPNVERKGLDGMVSTAIVDTVRYIAAGVTQL